MAANTVTVKARQSVLDIAIQTAGTLESVFEVAEDNGLSITDLLTAGQSLITPDVAVQDVVSYFSSYAIYPASAAAAEYKALVNGGVDYMSVGYSFKVS